jgi:hypothetical protein
MIPDRGALPIAWAPDWTLPRVQPIGLECALRNTFVLRNRPKPLALFLSDLSTMSLEQALAATQRVAAKASYRRPSYYGSATSSFGKLVIFSGSAI